LTTRGAVRIGRLGFLRREDRRQLFISDDGAARGAARVVVTVGDDDEDRLTDIHHFAGRQDWIIVNDRTAIVGADDVFRCVDRDHTGRAAHRRQVYRGDAGMGLGRQSQRGVQRALDFRNVVGISGLAKHVQLCRLMRAGDADSFPGLFGN
jgi:hypothetical protein